VARDGAATSTNLQDFAFEDILERAQDIGTRAAQMVKRRPISTMLAKLCGKNCDVRGMADDGSNTLLGFVAIAISNATVA